MLLSLAISSKCRMFSVKRELEKVGINSENSKRTMYNFFIKYRESFLLNTVCVCFFYLRHFE